MSNSGSKFFDIQGEKDALAAILHDEEVLEYALPQLTTDDFETKELSYLFEIIRNFHARYARTLSREVLLKWLTKHDPDRKAAMMLVFSDIDSITKSPFGKYYVDSLKSYTSRRRLFRIHETITNGLNNDADPDKLHNDLLVNLLTTSHSGPPITRTSVFGDIDERIRIYQDKKRNPEKYAGIPYGFEELDELTGGMYSGHLNTIIGRTGGGKSRMLFNIGCNVALTKKLVMYCTIEMEAAVIQNMYESRALSIPLTKILRATLSPEEEELYLKFLRESESAKVPFYIVDIPQGCTTGMILSEIEVFKKIHGRAPDLVLIDYANLITPMERFKDRPEKYDHVFRELKEGARANRSSFYTAAQMNRESLKTKDVGTEHIAFSDAAAYHCDTIFRVFADKANEAADDIQIEVIKGRYHGKSKISLYWGRETNLIRSWGKAELQKRNAFGDEELNDADSEGPGDSVHGSSFSTSTASLEAEPL